MWNSDQECAELLAMVSPEAIRERILERRSLLLALLSGEDLLRQGTRAGGPEEMLRVSGLRAPFAELSPEELDAWRRADSRHESLYREYERNERAETPTLR